MNIGWFVDTIRKVEITHLDSTDQSEIGYFLRYFTSKLNYPAEAIENGYSGTVYTEFNIDSSGHLVNVRMLRKVYPALDNLVY